MLLKLRRMIIRRIFLILLVVASQYIFFSSVVFKIKDIVVEGCEVSDPRQIISVCQFRIGDYYWCDRLFYDSSFLPDNSTFKSMDVSLRRGGKVAIKVEDKKPVVCVWLDSAKKWYLADADGDILCPMRSGDKYPCLKLGYTLTALGSVNKGVIATVLELEPKIEKIAGGASVFYSVDQCQNFTVYINFLGRETEVLLGNTGSAEPKLRVLDIILKTMRGKGRKLNSVDVRFRLPGVIAYNPNSPLGSLQNPKVSEHKPKSLMTAAEKAAAEKELKASSQTEKAVKAEEPAALAAGKDTAEPKKVGVKARAAGETAERSETEAKELKIADSFADAPASGVKAEELKRSADTTDEAENIAQAKPLPPPAAAVSVKKETKASSPAVSAEPASGLKAPKPILDPAPQKRSAAPAAASARAESTFSADNDFSPIPEAFMPED